MSCGKYSGGEIGQGHQSYARELTDANNKHESGLADIKRIEPSSSRTSEAEKSPFFIEYSPSFNSTYFAYIEHMSRLRQQEQIQRHKRDAEQSRLSEIARRKHEYSEVWGREGLELVRSNRSDCADLQEQLRSSAGNQLNESRSTIIADYRATASAAQRATETARASLTAYSGAEQNHRRIRELQQQTGELLQSVERERKRADQYHQETTESEVIRGFITKLGEQLKSAITEPFRAISDWVKSKERDQRTIANDDLYRNREADSTINPTASKETRLGEQLSRKISGFSTDPIYKALDELDRRRELQLEQQRKNDRGYDSLSPF